MLAACYKTRRVGLRLDLVPHFIFCGTLFFFAVFFLKTGIFRTPSITKTSLTQSHQITSSSCLLSFLVFFEFWVIIVKTPKARLEITIFHFFCIFLNFVFFILLLTGHHCPDTEDAASNHHVVLCVCVGVCVCVCV